MSNNKNVHNAPMTGHRGGPGHRGAATLMRRKVKLKNPKEAEELLIEQKNNAKESYLNYKKLI